MSCPKVLWPNSSQQPRPHTASHSSLPAWSGTGTVLVQPLCGDSNCIWPCLNCVCDKTHESNHSLSFSCFMSIIMFHVFIVIYMAVSWEEYLIELFNLCIIS